jgi:histidyl-tRNA synthetase
MGFAPPRGTADLLPPTSEAMRRLYEEAHALARLYGYRYVETPAFESTEIFSRTTGETSDVVRKEMYTFRDKAGRSLSLRPEGTPSVVRAVLAPGSGIRLPFKGYYVGPMWRYGRPQKGRQREFRQFGVEVLGTAAPSADVETIALGAEYMRRAGLREFRVEVNSLGDSRCRPAYRRALLAYLEANRGRLRDEHEEHYADNPLRVLDCKDEACRELALAAPKMRDHLCDACRQHFDGVLRELDEIGLAWERVDTLVRGLDYYVRTAYEYVSPLLPEGQASLGGGGRYDGLAELLGLPATPGVGFALGLDRILLAVGEEGGGAVGSEQGVFVVTMGPDARRSGGELVGELRAAGVPAQAALGERSLKGQLRTAERAGARFVAILGEREVASDTVTLRRLPDGFEETVPRVGLVGRVKEQAGRGG